MTRTKQPDGRRPSLSGNVDQRKKQMAAASPDPASDDDGSREPKEVVMTPARIAKLAKISQARQRIRKLRMISAASEHSTNHVLQAVHVRSIIRDVIRNQPNDSSLKLQPNEIRTRRAAVETFRESAQADLDNLLQKCCFVMSLTQSIQLSAAHVNAALAMGPLTAEAKKATGDRASHVREQWLLRKRQLTGQKLKPKKDRGAAADKGAAAAASPILA